MAKLHPARPNIFPTGDRTPQALWHRGRARAITDGARRISDLPDAEAAAELAACCASEQWVERMLSQRPFKDVDEVFESAERIWRDISAADRSAAKDDVHAVEAAALEQLKIIRLRLEKLLTL